MRSHHSMKTPVNRVCKLSGFFEISTLCLQAEAWRHESLRGKHTRILHIAKLLQLASAAFVKLIKMHLINGALSLANSVPLRELKTK